MKKSSLKTLFLSTISVITINLLAIDESDNLIINGNFEKLDEQGNPVSWTPLPKSASIKTESENKFVSFRDGGFINQKITIPPDVKAFFISAKIRTNDLVLGERQYNDARVNSYYKIASDERKYYTEMPKMRYNSDWQTVSVISRVIENADTLVIEPCILCKGVADFDDIKVIPLRSEQELKEANKEALSGRILKLKSTGLEEAKFERINSSGIPYGWDFVGNPNSFSVKEEDGKKTLTVEVKEAHGDAKLISFVQVDPGIKKIKVSASASGNVQKGSQSWSGGKIQAVFYDFADKKLSEGYPQTAFVDTQSDWKDYSIEVNVPQDESYLKIEIGLIGNSTGTYKVRNLKIEPAN